MLISLSFISLAGMESAHGGATNGLPVTCCSKPETYVIMIQQCIAYRKHFQDAPHAHHTHEYELESQRGIHACRELYKFTNLQSRGPCRRRSRSCTGTPGDQTSAHGVHSNECGRMAIDVDARKQTGGSVLRQASIKHGNTHALHLTNPSITGSTHAPLEG